MSRRRNTYNRKTIVVVVLAAAFVVALSYKFFFSATKELVVLCPDSLASRANQLAEEYASRSSSDVRIEVVSIPDDEYDAAKIAEKLSDKSANAAVLVNGQSPVQIKADLYDMAPILEASNNCAVALGSGRESAYALPLTGQVSVLAYHADMLADMGGSGPHSWADFYADALYLAEEGVTPLCFEPEVEGSFARDAILDACITPRPEDTGAEASSNGDEPSIGAMTYQEILAFFDENSASFAHVENHDAALQAFKDAKCAMAFVSSAEYLELSEAVSDCSAVSIPANNDDAYFVFSPQTSLVASASVRGDAAEDAFAWLSDKKLDADGQTASGSVFASGDNELFASHMENYFVQRVEDHRPFVLSVLWQTNDGQALLAS